MTYQALYRVYRPQRFDQLVGQDTITRTLKHAIAENKTSHAYLFTGPRGTGKTSAAKIFAKAINCPHQEDGEPCNQCQICQQASQGSLNDIIEIDAASNNGVEEIRDIREKAYYAPTQAAYKVYIIDEVHMLSQGAFNALLKTLEEPPPHVVFILATTEPHKIPLTIISRTQRFDFKRINEKAMVDRMQEVMEAEGLAYDDEVLPLIAQAAEGGMRDALSILDQTVSYALDRVTVEDAMLVTGGLTQDLLLDYIQALHLQQPNEAFQLLQQVLDEGKAPQRFADDVILFSRDLLVNRQHPQKQELLKRARLSDEFENLSQDLDPSFLYRVIRVFNQAQHDLRLSNHAPVYLEVATVQLTQDPPPAADSTANHPQADMDLVKELEKQIIDIQVQIKDLSQPTAPSKASGPAMKKPSRPPSSKGKVAFRPNKAQIFSVLKEATKQDLADMKDLWPDLLNALSTTGRALIHASQPVAASPGGAVISFQYDILSQKAADNTELQDEMDAYIQKVRGQKCRLVYVTASQWPALRQEFIDQMSQHKATEEDRPQILDEAAQAEKEKEEENQKIVDQAVQMFGADIVNIKDE